MAQSTRLLLYVLCVHLSLVAHTEEAQKAADRSALSVKQTTKNADELVKKPLKSTKKAESKAESKKGVAKVKPSLGNAHKKEPVQRSASLSKKRLTAEFGDSLLEFSVRLRVEGFFGQNTEFLNNANGGLDKTIIPARHTIDGTALYSFGRDKFGYDSVAGKLTIRNKCNWGAPESIASTDRSLVPIAGLETGSHFHTLNRNFGWIREIWLQFCVNDSFNLRFSNNHLFTLGYFPFELGRGIALGDAYAVDPDFLGFYSPNAVDQYAPGFKLSGVFDLDELVRYDLYLALLTNRSDNTANVRKKIRAQEYGHEFAPARGFGVINWLVAGRMQWHVYKAGDRCDVVLEPYALFMQQREQQVHFLADATLYMGTVGFAADIVLDKFEWGFEFAQNLGTQQVKGWDRNTLVLANVNGTVVQSNTNVSAIATIAPDIAGQNALATPANEAIIRSSVRAQSQNGKQIGSSNLKNSARRFRDPYVNTLDGYMGIWDASYEINSQFKVAATVGIATGDKNPNKDFNARGDSERDSSYSGFVSIQEQYSGKRVNSAFLMSGAGKIPRILSFPLQGLDDAYPDKTSQFTNLIFSGVGGYFNISGWKLNSNILSYWQEQQTRVFKVFRDPTSAFFASRWLGIEFNLFADVVCENGIKLYAVTSVFVPGSHYSDLVGIPLNKPQRTFLDSVAGMGVNPAEQVAIVGTSPAFTLNVGVQYQF